MWPMSVQGEELPTGTVTMLFSDIEGSTAMVHRLGELWPEVLQQQREICRESWTKHSGIELGTEGDSFFVVFETAEQAVEAALEATRSIKAAEWPGGDLVRVRVGIHTGSPQRHAEGYVGLDVHKAARVAAAAHGGQVLLSEATAHLVRDSMDPESGLLDLGEHRLKDIPHPLRLFQLTADGLDQAFPAVRTVGGAGSLPDLSTPTVGRDGELRELRDLLLEEKVRLITLTGPGGSGKTRLATALAGDVADAYPDGVYFVSLASVTATTDTWITIAQVLGVPANGQVPPGFFDHVSQSHVLLVLDNLEQIPDVHEVVHELLNAAQHITVVATSRRALHLAGEYDHQVPPLVLPLFEEDGSPTLGEVQASGAAQMFLEHARRAKRGFTLTETNAADVARLCIALDGLPLAIELASARVKMLSPAAILARIDQALDLSDHDRTRHSRQHTIRETIAWSYDLLSPAQQGVLDHIGVFEGGASLAGLQAVVPPAGLESLDLLEVLFELVDASLVRVEDNADGEPRFWLLETVRRFAGDRLELTETWPAAVTGHGQYFYDLAKALFAADRDGDPGWRARFLEDLENYRTVLERTTQGISDLADYENGVVPPHHVAVLFARNALAVGKPAVSDQWVRIGLAMPGAMSDPVGHAALLTALSRGAWAQGRLTEAVDLAADATRGVGHDADQRHAPLWVEPMFVAEEARYRQGLARMGLGDLDAAQSLAEEVAVLEEKGGPHLQRHGLAAHLAWRLSYERGDYEAAQEQLTALTSSSSWFDGKGVTDRVSVHNNLADLDLHLGRAHDAQSRLTEHLELALSTGNIPLLLVWAATFAEVIGTAHPLVCARAYGATATVRVVEGLRDSEAGQAEDERVMASARALVTPEEWDAAFERGKHEDLFALLHEMAALPPLESD